MANYKKHSSKLKAKIALEALKETKTLSELSSEYGVASSQISTWKQHLQQGAEEIFIHTSTLQQQLQAQQEKEALLYQQIGQLQMEVEWLKKSLNKGLDERRAMIDSSSRLSISRQCQLLSVSRSGYYYQPATESEENLRLMRLMDEQYLTTPFYSYRRMWAYLSTKGYGVNLKRVHR